MSEFSPYLYTIANFPHALQPCESAPVLRWLCKDLMFAFSSAMVEDRFPLEDLLME